MPEIRGSFSHELKLPYVLQLPEGRPPRGGFPLLVLLHGFGQDARRFLARIPKPPDLPYARLFPSAPFPVVVGEGEERRLGRSWYAYSGEQTAFLAALEQGEELLLALLREVRQEVVELGQRAALLGHSQGGYLGSFLALRHPEIWRALAAISCRVKTEVLEAVLDRAREVAVLMVHGQRDRATPWLPQERALQVLRAHGLRVELCLHPGGHGLAHVDWRAVDAFMRRHLLWEEGADGRIS